MLVLSLDTSTAMLSVALSDVDEPAHALAARDLLAPNRHGELLAPLLDEVLGTGPDRPDLAAVAVGLGPGPFTGLRVGVVTAAAMSDALAVPAYGMCSLDVVAARHRDPGAGRGLLVVADARRRQVYWARYDAAGARVDGPEIDPPAVLAGRFGASGLRVCGAGAALHAEAFAGFDVAAADAYPSAATLAEEVAPRVRAGAPADPLDPFYLRRPDARPPAAPKRVTPA